MSPFQKRSNGFRGLSVVIFRLFFSFGILVFFSVLLPTPEALPATVTLAWDPPANSPVPIAGYKLYYGIGSRQYSTVIDVGSQTTCQVQNLVEGSRYYFAATDYDSARNESGYSNEVSYTVPVSTNPSTNRAPVASNGSLTTMVNTTATGTLVASDADGNALTYSLVTNGSKGTATVTNRSTGAYSYTPNTGVTGTDTFTFKANDGTADSNVATITVTINAANRAPTASNSSFSTTVNTQISRTLTASDPDGDSLTFSIVSGASNGSATITNSATGAFTYSPYLNITGNDSFTFRVSDGRLYSNTATVSLTVSLSTTTAKTSDLSGDGRPDILWHNQSTGELYASYLSGTSFTGGSALSPDRVSDTNWQIRGLADFDRDGKLDILWHHQRTGELYVWLMNGVTQKAGAALTPNRVADLDWRVAAVADFDRDGNADILWQHAKTGALYVWIMDRLTQTSRSSYLTPSSISDKNWQVKAVSDFNGDGRLDILWENMATGYLYVWIMDGLTQTGGQYLTPNLISNTKWQIRVAADFNRDGKTDILWQDASSGSLYLWTMNRLVQSGGSYLTPNRTFDRNWQIVVR